MVGSARVAPPPGAAIETSKLVELTRSEFDVTAVEFIRGGAAAAAGIAVPEPGPGLIADHIAVRFRNRSNRRRIQQFSDFFSVRASNFENQKQHCHFSYPSIISRKILQKT